MTKYVGLTDHPDQRYEQHGSPKDWKTIKFETEQEARSWEVELIQREQAYGGPGGKGWHFGYMYTVSDQTKDNGEAYKDRGQKAFLENLGLKRREYGESEFVNEVAENLLQNEEKLSDDDNTQ